MLGKCHFYSDLRHVVLQRKENSADVVWRDPDTVSDFTGARITCTSSSESDHVLPIQPELLEQTGIKYVLSQPFGQLMLRACERQRVKDRLYCNMGFPVSSVREA